ncbi:MAG: hypothetical protein HRT47_03630 [Candidatus Caenarcaniphilales bacterium]|nr:hypothetical protein [Candidatus Caenarcaniphilales bacterium]
MVRSVISANDSLTYADARKFNLSRGDIPQASVISQNSEISENTKGDSVTLKEESRVVKPSVTDDWLNSVRSINASSLYPNFDKEKLKENLSKLINNGENPLSERQLALMNEYVDNSDVYFTEQQPTDEPFSSYVVPSENGNLHHNVFINKANIINTAESILGREIVEGSTEEKMILDAEVARQITGYALQDVLENDSEQSITIDRLRRAISLPVALDFDSSDFTLVNVAFNAYDSKNPLSPGVMIHKHLINKLEDLGLKDKFTELRYPKDSDDNYLLDDQDKRIDNYYDPAKYIDLLKGSLGEEEFEKFKKEIEPIVQESLILNYNSINSEMNPM